MLLSLIKRGTTEQSWIKCMRHSKGKFHVVWGKLVCNHAYAGVYNFLRLVKVWKCKLDLMLKLLFSLKSLIKFYKTLSKFYSCVIVFLSVSLEILLPCGNKLVAPTFHEGQKLDGNVIQKVFKRASLYLRPSKPLQVSTSH